MDGFTSRAAWDEKLIESVRAQRLGWSFTFQWANEPEHAASAAVETFLRWNGPARVQHLPFPNVFHPV